MQTPFIPDANKIFKNLLFKFCAENQVQYETLLLLQLEVNVQYNSELPGYNEDLQHITLKSILCQQYFNYLCK